MSSPEPTVIFLGSGRCYHTMDWFRSAQALRPLSPPVMVTDQIEGESFVRLLKPEDRLDPLLIIDGLLFRRQSRGGDVWRNMVKFLLLPVQALRLRRLLGRYPVPVIHAHSMYYVALARLAGRPYVATPQGSELLVRPFRSRAYRAFARYALMGARRITVDSAAMQQSAQRLYGLHPLLIQNGIDLEVIRRLAAGGQKRDKVVSIRGLVPNYRIELLLQSRNASLPDMPIHFCYPFQDEGYRQALAGQFISSDQDLGRLPRSELYSLLLSARLVVSIPVSDSSPRSVYEAIFCGCIVATTESGWLNGIPACMRSRLVLVDVAESEWLRRALDQAEVLAAAPYVPSPEALALYDQKESMRRFYVDVYPAVASP